MAAKNSKKLNEASSVEYKKNGNVRQLQKNLARATQSSNSLLQDVKILPKSTQKRALTYKLLHQTKSETEGNFNTLAQPLDPIKYNLEEENDPRHSSNLILSGLKHQEFKGSGKVQTSELRMSISRLANMSSALLNLEK